MSGKASKESVCPLSNRSSVQKVNGDNLVEDGEGKEENEENGETGEHVEEEVVEEEIEEPYCPPPPNFIYILDKDNKPTPSNADCRKTIFLDYIKRKANLVNDIDIDLCDIDGALVGIPDLGSNEYVNELLLELNTYIPCLLTTTNGKLSAIEPLLTDWEVKYPQMIESFQKQIDEEAC